MAKKTYKPKTKAQLACDAVMKQCFAEGDRRARRAEAKAYVTVKEARRLARAEAATVGQ